MKSPFLVVAARNFVGLLVGAPLDLMGSKGKVPVARELIV